jgi:hypothetical protein
MTVESDALQVYNSAAVHLNYSTTGVFKKSVSCVGAPGPDSRVVLSRHTLPESACRYYRPSNS